MTVESIFNEMGPVKVKYINAESILSIKNKIVETLDSNPDNLLLFCNERYLEENLFMHQIDSKERSSIQYCNFMELFNIIK